MAAKESPNRLQGVRVIIVEDSFVVAQSLELLLGSYGCDIVGMAANVESSLVLVEGSDLDIAVLDIRLGRELVTDVADRIIARDKPLIFVTGYGDADLLPSHLQSYPCLHKPVDSELLVETIAELVH